MLKYVIYDPTNGAIRCVMTGDPILVTANLRDGEEIVEHYGYVSPAKHKVENGAVVLQ